MSIYSAMKNAGVPMLSHESDLYVQRTPQAVEILDAFQKDYPEQWEVINGRMFISPLDGNIWIELPFQNEPWWQANAAITNLSTTRSGRIY